MTRKAKPPGWTDVSSFSRHATDRTPFAWSLQAGPFDIHVHRHIHYEPDQWLLSCDPICDKRLLKAREIDKAKAEALLYVEAQLQAALAEITAARGVA